MADSNKSGDGKPAGTGSTAHPAGSSGGGTPGGVDWESDANPYKKRYKGRDSQATALEDKNRRLEGQLGDLREVKGMLTRFENRIGGIEELSAETADHVTALRRGSGEYGAEETEPTGQGHLEGLRQKRTAAGHQAEVKRTHDRINVLLSGDPKLRTAVQGDERLVQARTHFLRGRDSYEERYELSEALRLTEEVVADARARLATEVSSNGTQRSAAAQSNNTDSPAGSGDDTSGDVGEDTQGADDKSGADGPTGRERIRASGAAAGQGGDGGSAVDAENMSARDKFAAAARGEGPQRR